MAFARKRIVAKRVNAAPLPECQRRAGEDCRAKRGMLFCKNEMRLLQMTSVRGYGTMVLNLIGIFLTQH